jgi:endonuclease/exonuclease/phosphatase family metal-dependent hydrolase
MRTTPGSAPRVSRVRVTLTALASAMLLVLMATVAVAAPPPQASNDRTVTVMTRNLYLGATLAPLFPDPPLSSPGELIGAASELWFQVLATNFPLRAKALAEEIATEQPDLIGLQEVTLYRIGAFNDPAPATTVRLDFLRVLQSELRSRGQRYDVAVSQAAFDGELPAMDWPVVAGGTGGLVDVRLTDRDVILVRRTSALNIKNAQGGIFSDALPLEVLGQPLPIIRGWTSVDVKHRGVKFRFINTHLEAFHAGVAALQAIELVTTGPAATTLPVVLTGDFNAAPGEPAYNVISIGAGFTDVADPGGGPTCCYDAALNDPTATLDSRIDLIFTRGAITTTSVHRVGVDPISDTQPRWASDHAGVVADLVLTK